MRATAILAPQVRPFQVRPFQQDERVSWTNIADAEVAVIFGGDGTVHRHLSSIKERNIPFLIVPTGSANDFASSLGLHSRRAALRAWEAFCGSQQNVATIDLGVIRIPASTHQQPDNYFCCIAYLGLDSATNALANRLPRFLRAHGGYVLSLFPTLLEFRAQRTTIRNASGIALHSERAMLTCFANTPRYGHGLRIAPEAKMTDGLLDLCFVRRLNKVKLLALFSSVYWGKHTRLPYVAMCRGTAFSVETETPAPLFADGEYVCHTPAEIGICPGAIRVIIPERAAL